MEQLKLNMIPNGVNPVFHASQNDKNRQIRFVLDETLSGEDVTIEYHTPDGAEYGNVQLSVSGSVITDYIPDDALKIAGIVTGEVTIDGRGSLNFFVNVEKDAYDGGDLIPHTASGAIANFETNIVAPMQSITADIVAVQSGTGTPSPSNPRPISGFNQAVITHTGINIVDFLSHLRASASGLTIESSDGGIHYYGTATAAFCQLTYSFNYSLVSGTTITFSRDVVLNHQQYLDLTFTDNTHDYLRIQANESSKTYTLAKDLKSLELICLGLTPGTSYDETVKFMIELGNTASDYEPYNGDTLTATFGTTVFGGSVDVTGGVVEVTHALFDLSTLSWLYNGSLKRWEAQKTDMKSYGSRSADVLFEKYETDTSATAGSENKGFIAGLVIYIASTDSVNSPTGNCLYPLATPTEISITPDTLNTISGVNNVWSDTGDIDVTYLVEE